jgi:hypothetical protein
MQTDKPLPPEPSKQNVLSVVSRDAMANTLYFILGTCIIIIIGYRSRRFGIVLAGIEALFAVVQSLKVLFIIVTDVMLFVAAHFGKRKREDDETEMRWATMIRMIELGIWMGCLFVLYKFFFR